VATELATEIGPLRGLARCVEHLAIGWDLLDLAVGDESDGGL
jgi:hypothetical protein